MTSVEMHHSVNLKLRTINPELFVDSYEVEKVLNEAQEVFIEKYRPYVDNDEIARKKLDPLIDTDSLTPAATAADNMNTSAVFVTMPGDFRDVLYEKAVISATDVDIKPVKYDEYNTNKDNPFKEPYASLVWRLDYGGGKHELIPLAGATITSYFIRYIKNPTALDIDAANTSDFKSKDHEEIVNIAVGIIINK
jgi:hypothetical protein